MQGCVTALAQPTRHRRGERCISDIINIHDTATPLTPRSRSMQIGSKSSSTLIFRSFLQHPKTSYSKRLFIYHRRRMTTSEHGMELLNEDQKRVVEDSLKLFCSQPSLEILNRSWSQDAHFGDPIASCYGFNQFAPQWFAMPKLFPKSVTSHWKIIKAESKLIEWEQTQEYTIRGINYVKKMESIVHIELGEDGKIVKFEDRWGGKELPSNSIAMIFRKLNANVVPYMIKVPKEDKKLD